MYLFFVLQTYDSLGNIGLAMKHEKWNVSVIYSDPRNSALKNCKFCADELQILH
jgi:hypothetical protein